MDICITYKSRGDGSFQKEPVIRIKDFYEHIKHKERRDYDEWIEWLRCHFQHEFQEMLYFDEFFVERLCRLYREHSTWERFQELKQKIADGRI